MRTPVRTPATGRSLDPTPLDPLIQTLGGKVVKHRARVLIALIAPLVPLLVVAQPAEAASLPTTVMTLQGLHVIAYGDQQVTRGGSRLVRYGTAHPDGGCQWPVSERTKPGQHIYETEIAYDPDTCRLLVERSAVQAGFADPASPGQLTTKDEQGSLASPTGPTGMAALASSPVDAYTWSWYDEPARWLFGCDVEDGVAEGCYLPVVNYVKNTITWSPDGNCTIPPGTQAHFGSQLAYLRDTGWTISSNYFSYNTTLTTCRDTLYSKNQASFNNRVFCGYILEAIIPGVGVPQVNATNTYYEPSGLEGFADGSALHITQLRKSGGCDALLKGNRRFGSGLG